MQQPLLLHEWQSVWSQLCFHLEAIPIFRSTLSHQSLTTFTTIPPITSRSVSSSVVVGLNVGDGLIGVVSLAVGEEVVDEHADNWEEEDDKSPEDLVGDGAVWLEDLNCSAARQLQPQNKLTSQMGTGRWEGAAKTYSKQWYRELGQWIQRCRHQYLLAMASRS